MDIETETIWLNDKKFNCCWSFHPVEMPTETMTIKKEWYPWGLH